MTLESIIVAVSTARARGRRFVERDQDAAVERVDDAVRDGRRSRKPAAVPMRRDRA